VTGIEDRPSPRPRGGSRTRGRAGLRGALPWGAALATALALAALSIVESAYFPLVELPKGSVAAHTIRATHDAVFDLHETYRAEAEEARLSYLPIYIRDGNLPWSRLQPILKAALAEPLSSWRYPEGGEEGSEAEGEGGASGAGSGSSDAGAPADAGGGDGGRAGGAAVDGAAGRERRHEVEALVRACFNLLETYYRDGVVGDSEFPKEKKTVRVLFEGEYARKAVADLHPFSSLRRELERAAAQFFFKTDARVRERVVAFILERLPPNLTYAKENARFIKDISQVTGVKVVLIRGGEILARRHQTIDTRAYHAIRASVMAAAETSVRGIRVGRLLLLVALMLLFVVATRELTAAPFRQLRAYVIVYGGIILLLAGGKLLLLYFPLHPAIVPQAALALIVAVTMGRAAGLIAGLIVPACFLLAQIFELSTLLVGAAGGVVAALSVRQRRRGSALAAGVLVGIVQALVFEASRALEGRPRTYAELWSAGQAFLGGLVCGGLSVVVLPIVERILGKSSRGKLRVLTDFDHPLLRELRERAPGTFAHTMTVLNMVEPAVEAVGGERLLARAGTLFHDLGKIEHPSLFPENAPPGAAPATLPHEERTQALLAHVADGVALARRHGLPRDVAAFIAEHHGTTIVADESDDEPRYPGPKPQSLETAILMIANGVEEAARGVDADRRAYERMVDGVILRALADFQFEECGVSQAELRRIKEAFVIYLEERAARRAPSPASPSPAAPLPPAAPPQAAS
jgi:putative nucleotidyltransferase with HDIG domain